MKLPDEYSRKYSSLLKNLSIGGKKAGDRKLTGFWPMVGEGYRQNEGTMYVGRATNGWGNRWEVNQISDDRGREIVVNSINENSRGGFSSWMTVGENDKTKYNMNRTAFFRVARQVQFALDGSGDTGSLKWTQNVCWSNLMKIAPEPGWNPPVWLQRLQTPQCVELLKMEVEFLCPKRILLLTGEDWFVHFREFLSLKFDKFSDSAVFVRGIAKTQTCTWVLAEHPMRRPEKPFVLEVLSAFKKME